MVKHEDPKRERAADEPQPQDPLPLARGVLELGEGLAERRPVQRFLLFAA